MEIEEPAAAPPAEVAGDAVRKTEPQPVNVIAQKTYRTPMEKARFGVPEMLGECAHWLVEHTSVPAPQVN